MEVVLEFGADFADIFEVRGVRGKSAVNLWNHASRNRP